MGLWGMVAPNGAGSKNGGPGVQPNLWLQLTVPLWGMVAPNGASLRMGDGDSSSGGGRKESSSGGGRSLRSA